MKIKGSRAIKSLLVATTATGLILGATGIASAASGTVTWGSNRYPGFLSDIGGGRVTTYADTSNIPLAHVWYDIQNSDGSWNEVNAQTGWCLTSFSNQAVYTEPCSSGKDATNWWQRWYEIQTPTGWKLQSRMTGFILDSGGPYPNNVYANPTDWGDSNSAQRWH
ncbi:hypothetical protein [Kitasatospora purpeofusca]|uniref:hypothetical protein n=1 Tax=Kitasatospora purpeofusca TaxID=67352 RepID=UPI00380D386C